MRALPSASEAAGALVPLRAVRLLHFESVRDAFGGFDTATRAREFGDVASRVLGAWCCKEGGKTLQGALPRRAHALASGAPLPAT